MFTFRLRRSTRALARHTVIGRTDISAAAGPNPPPTAVEPLESRVLLSASPARNVVYVESNNPTHGKNAILAYHRDPASGALTPLAAGASFLTHGTGFFDADDRLGPDDSDQELIASADHRFLFAVNQGSNTVSVFRIHANGTLTLVPSAPVKSGGVQPVSLGLSGSTLIVVNRGDAAPGATVGDPPNYTSFHVGSDGRLKAIKGSTIKIGLGSSPSQALVSHDGKFLFGDNFFAQAFPAPPGFPPFVPPFATMLESFKIGSNGKLTRAPGSPYGFPLAPPVPPFILGLANHPSKNIVYAGVVVGNKLAVYSYNGKGALHFERAVPITGAGICWLVISKDAKRLYAADSTSNTIAVFSLADPYHPVELQDLQLNGPKAPLPPPPGPVIFNTVPFQLGLSPDGKNLYVVNHEATLDNSFPQGNALHVLKVQPDGLLTEAVSSPTIFSEKLVPAGAHPQGLVVL